MMKDILEHNKKFVANKDFEKYVTDKYPAKKIAIVTCMDTRLVEMLPAALGIRNGDVKMIKNAGGMVSDNFDTTMRSILVAIYELGVEHVMIIGHTNCGVQGMNGKHFIELMKERGIQESAFKKIEKEGIDLEKWLTGFCETEDAVRDSVNLVRNHPLLPKGIDVTGYVIDTTTGELMPVEK